MRALLPNLHSLLGSLTLPLGIFFLTACTTDHKTPVDPPEVNTYNAYINTVDNTISYYTIKNDNLITYKLADFAEATNDFQTALAFDIDEEKQGFEYIAYVTRNSQEESVINLFDLDKANNNKHYVLANLSSHICGISAIRMPTTHAFQDRKESNVSTKHLPEIILHVSASTACDGDIFYEKIDFSTLIDEDIYTTFEHSVVSEGKHDPELVIDYDSAKVISSVWQGNYGYLSYNNNSSELSFNYAEIDRFNEIQTIEWSTQLPFTEPLTFTQVSNNKILAQQGSNLFVIPTSYLFTVDDPTSSSTPIQARINAIFDTPTLTLNGYTNLTLNTSQPVQQSNFVIQVENDLYLYESDRFELIYSNSKSTEDVSLTYRLNSANELLLLTEETGKDDLLTVIYETGNESNIDESEEISIYINDDTFHFNSYNSESGSQAHILTKKNSNYEPTSFEESTLIFVKDMRNQDDLPLLISSSPVKNVSGTRQLSGAYLYKYDEDKDNGRALAQSSRENENGNKEHRSVDFSYGIFHELSNLEFMNGSVINDYYSFLNFEATYSLEGVEQRANFSFIFNPSQETPDPDIEDQSLSLLLVDGM
jgi:hypothetical protein